MNNAFDGPIGTQHSQEKKISVNVIPLLTLH